VDKIRVHVMIPKDLYERIREIAEQEHRSLSAQMAHFLQESAWRYRPPKEG
jgi:hypothetical protein